ncbi:MAG: 50S ribosomal protein L11 methyltransferase [Flavobacterium sp.]|nr:50S ribosomal protein L11 methyltransferase [Pedobacter sp.]
MDYKELIFTIYSKEEFHRDILINSLSEIGFETFEETVTGFKAYIPANLYNETKLGTLLGEYKGLFNYSYQESTIPYKNWNKEWESNYKPIKITDQCYVRANFHPAKPGFKYEIVINPKMAFGTGHHQTTSMMMQWMVNEDIKSKTILDMGCGTGILAILAGKMGATKIVAIDNDPLCFESSIENKMINKTSLIQVLCGSIEEIPTVKFDYIFANINRNILLTHLETYARILKSNGLLFLSGFYLNPDLDILIQKAASIKLKYISHKEVDNWVAAKFIIT